MMKIKTLKAVEIGKFKDGGTIKVIAENGNTYFLDGRIDSKGRGIDVYDKNPSLITAKLLSHVRLDMVDSKEYRQKFLQAQSDKDKLTHWI